MGGRIAGRRAGGRAGGRTGRPCRLARAVGMRESIRAGSRAAWRVVGRFGERASRRAGKRVAGDRQPVQSIVVYDVCTSLGTHNLQASVRSSRRLLPFPFAQLVFSLFAAFTPTIPAHLPTSLIFRPGLRNASFFLSFFSSFSFLRYLTLPTDSRSALDSVLRL